MHGEGVNGCLPVPVFPVRADPLAACVPPLLFLSQHTRTFLETFRSLSGANSTLIQHYRNVKIMNFPMSAHMFIPDWNSTAYGTHPINGNCTQRRRALPSTPLSSLSLPAPVGNSAI